MFPQQKKKKKWHTIVCAGVLWGSAASMEKLWWVYWKSSCFCLHFWPGSALQYSCVQNPFTLYSVLLAIQWDRSKIFTLVLNYLKKQMQQLPLKAVARWTLNGGLFLLLLSVQGALLLLAISVRSSIAVDHFCFRLLCVHMAMCGECKEEQILLLD